MRQIQGGVVALGAVLVTTVGAAAWKASSLRSDTIEKYKPRMQLARAGLEERAATCMRSLAEEVNTVLGDIDKDFEPGKALADPSDLQDYVRDFGKTLKARQALPRYLDRLLRAGPALTALLTALVVALIAAFSYYCGWSRARTFGMWSAWIAMALAVLVALVFVYCAVAQHKFSAAEILSAPTDDP